MSDLREFSRSQHGSGLCFSSIVLAPPGIHVVYLIIWEPSQVKATFLSLQFLREQGPAEPVGGHSTIGERERELWFLPVLHAKLFGST